MAARGDLVWVSKFGEAFTICSPRGIGFRQKKKSRNSLWLPARVYIFPQYLLPGETGSGCKNEVFLYLAFTGVTCPLFHSMKPASSIPTHRGLSDRHSRYTTSAFPLRLHVKSGSAFAQLQKGKMDRTLHQRYSWQVFRLQHHFALLFWLVRSFSTLHLK
jgi:hypothetical protein